MELGFDRSPIEIAPFSSVLPQPMKIGVECVGDRVKNVNLEFGYIYRGIEENLDSISWEALIPLADRIDPNNAIFAEAAVCEAVEALANIEVPPRALAIRMLLLEMNRINSHIYNLWMVSKAVGAETISFYLQRDREKILDLFELVTGSRYSFNYFCYGGVLLDVTDGFLDRVVSLGDMIRLRGKEYRDLLLENQIFLNRAGSLYPVSKDDVMRYCLTGPVARASGIHLDYRTEGTSGNYSRYEFRIPMGNGEFGVLGDVVDRIYVRFREIYQSILLINQIADQIQAGDYLNEKVEKRLTIGGGVGYSRVETSRGLLACCLAADREGKLTSLSFRTPSSSLAKYINDRLGDVALDDLFLILNSFDLSPSEIDK